MTKTLLSTMRGKLVFIVRAIMSRCSTTNAIDASRECAAGESYKTYRSSYVLSFSALLVQKAYPSGIALSSSE